MAKIVVSRDGTRIAYEVSGHGPALILVDGAFCYREFGPMRKLAAELAGDFRVIIYDRRARGASGTTRPYAIEREIEDIHALILAAGGRAHLYGISSGAALALAATAASLPVIKLALYEAPFMVGPQARELPDDRNVVLQKMVDEGRHGDAVKYYLSDIIGVPRVVPFVFQILPMWKKLKSVAPSLPYDCAVMGDFKLPMTRAASITVPTLALEGGSTMPVLRGVAKIIAEAIPGARHQTLVGQTHNVKAGVIGPVLREFFKT